MSNSDWYSAASRKKFGKSLVQEIIESERFRKQYEQCVFKYWQRGMEMLCPPTNKFTNLDEVKKLFPVEPVGPIEMKSLSLDVSLEKVRALHRVWRALNDGDCPKCHKFHAATDIIRRTGVGAPNIQCPSCKFYIFMSEIEYIERMFAPAMDAAVAIFEDWRAKGRVLS